MIAPMISLRETMAQFGFESNDDYEFQIRCLLDDPLDRIRTLNIDGDGERRKTAFANALAYALAFPRILYHDFSEKEPPPPDVVLPPTKDEMGVSEQPVDPLDDIVSKACAFSEAEPTILILDQIHHAEFREHLRLHRLIRDKRWKIAETPYFANPRNLLLFLISEEPLYHSLQTESYRVWINRVSARQVSYAPHEFGLEPDAEPLFAAIAELLEALDSPLTRSEMRLVLRDLHMNVRTVEHLRHCLYGRAEAIERERLFSDDTLHPLKRVVDAIEAYLGTECIELAGTAAPR